MSVPRTIAAGATLLFTETVSGYPASANTLVFSLFQNGENLANITGTTSGDAYTITATAAVTSSWGPGRCLWALNVTTTATGAVTQVCTGQLSVTPNLAASVTATASQTQLAALDAAILKLVANPNVSVNFSGQEFTSRSLKEMFDIRDRLQVRVDSELRSMGLSTRGGARTIHTRFC